ncbi:MAG TPA: SH3 domain-containing protein, partial [Anaerolineales bacterium]
GKSLKRAISHVILYEAYGASPTQPGTDPAPVSKIHARVKDSVTWGLNIRSSIDTSSPANVIEVVPAGTQLVLLEADGASRIGAINQWVRVRTPQGKEGFAAGWYLDNVPEVTPAPVPVEEPPASTPEPQPVPTPPQTPAPTPAELPKEEEKFVVVVSSAVGTSGLRLRKTASKGGALIAILKAGTRLTVLEPAPRAKSKVGKANQWLHVRVMPNQRGYVSAEYVTIP